MKWCLRSEVGLDLIAFVEIWLRNNVYGHAVPTADLSKAVTVTVVSDFRKYGQLVLEACPGSVWIAYDRAQNDLNSVEKP